VAAVSTAVLDVPTRAPRSIAGRVYLRVANDKTVPAGDPGNLKIGGVPQNATNGQRGQQAGGKRGQAVGQQNSPAPEEPEFTLVPLAGVPLTAGYRGAESPGDGKLLLRALPPRQLQIPL